WMDECDAAYEKCKCAAKSSSGGKRAFSTKSLGTMPVPRAPETKTLGGSSASRGTYETKSGSGTITENDLADALRQLRGIRAQCQCNQQGSFVEKQLKDAQGLTETLQGRFQEELAQSRAEQRKIYW